jgi:hypothetical protein
MTGGEPQRSVHASSVVLPVHVLGDDDGPARGQQVINTYVAEIQRQSRFALVHLDTVLTLADPTDPHDGRVWAALQGALVAAGIVSRMFDASGARRKDARKFERAKMRAEYLRSLLSVELDAVICNRDLRDDLEHLDERLDELSHNPDVGFFFDGFISNGGRPMPPRGPGYPSDGKVHVLRSMDPTAGFATFQDHDFDLFALRDELTSIERKATDVLARPAVMSGDASRIAFRLEEYGRKGGLGT